MQQDAHEFLNFLINHINEIILGELSTWAHCFYYNTIWHLDLCMYGDNDSYNINSVVNNANYHDLWTIVDNNKQ